MRMGNYEVNNNSEKGGTEFIYKPTIKVIDLLNKITSGEEVPEKIIYNNKIFFLNNKYHWYYTTDDYNLWYDVCGDIETEVEVIKEDPEDEEIVQWSNLAISEMKKEKTLSGIKNYIETIMRTQNEIIEKIETLD